MMSAFPQSLLNPPDRLRIRRDRKKRGAADARSPQNRTVRSPQHRNGVTAVGFYPAIRIKFLQQNRMMFPERHHAVAVTPGADMQNGRKIRREKDRFRIRPFHFRCRNLSSSQNGFSETDLRTLFQIPDNLRRCCKTMQKNPVALHANRAIGKTGQRNPDAFAILRRRCGCGGKALRQSRIRDESGENGIQKIAQSPAPDRGMKRRPIVRRGKSSSINSVRFALQIVGVLLQNFQRTPQTARSKRETLRKHRNQIQTQKVASVTIGPVRGIGPPDLPATAQFHLHIGAGKMPQRTHKLHAVDNGVKPHRRQPRCIRSAEQTQEQIFRPVIRLMSECDNRPGRFAAKLFPCIQTQPPCRRFVPLARLAASSDIQRNREKRNRQFHAFFAAPRLVGIAFRPAQTVVEMHRAKFKMKRR